MGMTVTEGWVLLFTVVLVAAVGAVTPVSGNASTIERSGTITCTSNPQQPYIAYSGKMARTACVVRHYSTTWSDEPSCTSGTLTLWGIGHFDTLTYFYTGRAVSPKLDGTTVSSSGSTPKTPLTWRRFSFRARGSSKRVSRSDTTSL